MTDERQFIEINRDKEIRCPECNRKFLEGELSEGTKIEIKCPRCKTLCRFEKL
jgi:phage FluMu protein Com